MSRIDEIEKLIETRQVLCMDIPMRDAALELKNLLQLARNHLYWMIADIDYRNENTGIAPHDSDDLKSAKELMEAITEI